MFGDPFPWIDRYIDNVQVNEGWYWKIFTPHKIESKGNVDIIPMDINEYNKLVDIKLGIKPNLAIINGKPNLHITDFYIFSGVVFEDYIKNVDFWGITNLDVVYGKLDHFYPDSFLDCDVFSDDVKMVNGVFSLWRNIPKVNHLFERIDNWKKMLAQPECKGCIEGGAHTLYGSDEYVMSEVLKQSPGICFKYLKYYPLLSHDRLQQHIPAPKLEIKEDGSLWELFEDTAPIPGPLSHPFFGREIPIFHFSHTKQWPPIA